MYTVYSTNSAVQPASTWTSEPHGPTFGPGSVEEAIVGDLGGASYPADAPVLEEERTWAMAAHLGVLAGSVVPLGNVIAPLVIWLVHKEKSPFVVKHALESLVFQVAMMVAAFALLALTIVTMGAAIILAVPAILFLVVASFVYMIVATIRASEGKIWEYPVTTRWVS